MSDIGQMIENAQADSWDDLDDDYVFDDEHVVELDRLESYVDYCFDHYDVVSDHLDRGQIQTAVANWDHRRGQCRPNRRLDQREFNKQVRRSHGTNVDGHYVILLATPLIGVPPKDDKGVGWKACVRHELGHAIDRERRGTSGHDDKFKEVMAMFGEGANDGQHAHGWAPSVHRD